MIRKMLWFYASSDFYQDFMNLSNNETSLLKSLSFVKENPHVNLSQRDGKPSKGSPVSD